MQNFAMTTWANDRMVAYEPVFARSSAEATAFVQGMVTERVRDHTSMLARLGVPYVIETGHRELSELTVFMPLNVIGTWHAVEVNGAAKLVWQPKDPEGRGMPE